MNAYNEFFSYFLDRIVGRMKGNRISDQNSENDYFEKSSFLFFMVGIGNLMEYILSYIINWGIIFLHNYNM